MKYTTFSRSVLFLLLVVQYPSIVCAQTSSFVYQGRLSYKGEPLNGAVDLRFQIYDADTGGSLVGSPSSVTADDVDVTDGLVTVALDFGSAVFDGDDLWLQIGIRPWDSASAYTTLSPRQSISPSPYAIRALNDETDDSVEWSEISGLVGTGASNVAQGNHTHPNAAWSLTGNSGTSAGTSFVGTTDNQALEMRANNKRVMRFEPDSNSPNLVGGHPNNEVVAGVSGGFIAGGGVAAYPNRVTDDYAAVLGGWGNVAGDGDASSTGGRNAIVCGGESNNATASYSFVGGGDGNIASATGTAISGGSNNSAFLYGDFVGGGKGNIAGFSVENSFAHCAVVAGGENNNAPGSHSAICGGNSNTAKGLNSFVGAGNSVVAIGSDSVVCGGYVNQATGTYSVIAGGGNNHAHSNYSAILGGQDNAAEAPHSTVSGGEGNAASGWHSNIAGGRSNTSTDDYCTVAGGRSNQAGNANSTVTDRRYATVGGGYNNESSGEYATIGGGLSNQAPGSQSFVGGGDANQAYGPQSTVAGGDSNTAEGQETFVGGGNANTATGGRSAITGGDSNSAGGNESFVGGGDTNKATDNYCTVVGGVSNQAGDADTTLSDAQYAFVGGGYSNLSTKESSAVVGGNNNGATGVEAFAGGGADNTASGTTSVVAGGDSNTASNVNATVGGGGGNTASGLESFVGGGSGNTASGSYSAVAGGNSNTAAGAYSFAGGEKAHADHVGSFVWGSDSVHTSTYSDRSHQFKVRASGGVLIDADSAGKYPAGLNVKADGSNALGLWVQQNSSDTAVLLTNEGSGHFIKAYGQTGGSNLRFIVENDGDVRADGVIAGGGADFAEMLPVSDNELEPGDVLSVGPNGGLVRSTKAFQTSVLGVYSTKPGFLGGASDTTQLEGKAPLAVIGIVPVKVTAENGPVRPGDLLAASGTPGHAMHAGVSPPIGSVIGKSLGTLTHEAGVVQMLVTLH